LQEVLVAGKTGTAQVIGHEFKGKVAAGVRTENHAWFVAYAPERAPEIAVAVLVEHGGGGGGVAAPIAKRILEAYFRGFKE
jgi:penicillin-binding protein 2